MMQGRGTWLRTTGTMLVVWCQQKNSHERNRVVRRHLGILTRKHPCCSASGRCSNGSDRRSASRGSRSTAPASIPLPPRQFWFKRCLVSSLGGVESPAQVKCSPVDLLMMKNSSLPREVPARAKTHWFSRSASSFWFVLFRRQSRVVGFLLREMGQHHLLQDDVLAIFHGNRDSAIFVAFDAVEARSNPVRHVGGMFWCEVLM